MLLTLRAVAFHMQVLLPTTEKKVQNDHAWSKHRMSKLWISTQSNTRDIQYCKMLGDSLLHFRILCFSALHVFEYEYF